MKKLILAIMCAAVLLTCVGVFAGCASEQTDNAVSTQLFDAAAMEKELADFLAANPDRTSQNKKDSDGPDGEERASEWLETRLSGTLGADNVVRRKFTPPTTETYGDEFESFNVVGTVYADEDKNPENYRIVIGANYDNRHETVKMNNYSANSFMGSSTANFITGTGAEGAMANGTGVATVLALADYFAREDVRSRLTVDVDFAFYGMGCINMGGSANYLNSLGATGRDKLLLAVNVTALGGDKLFAYFDEVGTPHGDFILGAAEDAGVGGAISEPPAMAADMAYQLTDALPYTPYQLVSDAGTFFGGYNVCALTSGSDNTFFLYERERADGDNIANTGADTLETLKRKNKNYAAQMAAAAETVATAVLKDGFTDACLASKAQIGGYAWLTYPIAGYATVAVISLIATVLIIVLVRRYEKNHRDDDPEIKRNVKVAVFGMDYEQPEDNDVFVDIRSHQPDDPFADAFGGEDKHDDDK